MHLRNFSIPFAIAALSVTAFAQPGAIPAAQNPDVWIDAYQINYLAAPVGGGTITGSIDFTNAGRRGCVWALGRNHRPNLRQRLHFHR